jgi:hypothetical protein
MFGQHAPTPTLVRTLPSISREGVAWQVGIFKCIKCGALTLRGETDQLKAWNTFIEWLTPEMATELMEVK